MASLNTRFLAWKVYNSAKFSRLDDLFRPPTVLDLSVSGSLQTAREFAKNQNRWLIVHLQDYGQFQSQKLNREVWSDEYIRSIIKQYFVFWQVNFLFVCRKCSLLQDSQRIFF